MRLCIAQQSESKVPAHSYGLPDFFAVHGDEHLTFEDCERVTMLRVHKKRYAKNVNFVANMKRISEIYSEYSRRRV